MAALARRGKNEHCVFFHSEKPKSLRVSEKPDRPRRAPLLYLSSLAVASALRGGDQLRSAAAQAECEPAAEPATRGKVRREGRLDALPQGLSVFLVQLVVTVGIEEALGFVLHLAPLDVHHSRVVQSLRAETAAHASAGNVRRCR